MLGDPGVYSWDGKHIMTRSLHACLVNYASPDFPCEIFNPSKLHLPLRIVFMANGKREIHIYVS